jgi:hypothetical protein
MLFSEHLSPLTQIIIIVAGAAVAWRIWREYRKL